MKLKIAVTDANIFIDLFDVGLMDSFFNMDLEIHTTEAVFHELYSEQQAVLKSFQFAGKLEVHNLVEQDFMDIYNENYPKSLSEADKSVLHVANRLQACILSSDKTVRNYAKNKHIEYHGMIWLFDYFVETNSLSTAEARDKLSALVSANFLYRNNHKLVDEIEKRIEIWGSRSSN
jgi:rRNA-processing protein FCF1